MLDKKIFLFSLIFLFASGAEALDSGFQSKKKPKKSSSYGKEVRQQPKDSVEIDTSQQEGDGDSPTLLFGTNIKPIIKNQQQGTQTTQSTGMLLGEPANEIIEGERLRKPEATPQRTAPRENPGCQYGNCSSTSRNRNTRDSTPYGGATSEGRARTGENETSAEGGDSGSQATGSPPAEQRSEQEEEKTASASGNPCADTDEYPNEPDELSERKLKSLISDLETYRDDFQTPTNRKDGDPDQAKICKRKIRMYEEALGEVKQCTEAVEDIKEKRADFVESCGEFSSGRMKCSVAIMACKMCPSRQNFGHYDCVKIHDRTECPAKSGVELESAKKKRKQLKEDREELQEDIADLEKDIVRKEGDINDLLIDLENDFSDTVNAMERAVEDQKADLEDGLRKQKAHISESVSQAIAAVQQELDKSLKIAHSFENEIIKANSNFRREKRQIIMECETQAGARLAKYRQRRNLAIQTGSLRFSVSSLLSRGRKADFNEVDADYRQHLRLIEQQKEQYADQLQKAKTRIQELHQKASYAQNSAVKEYAVQMNKILANHEHQHNLAYQRYLRNKSNIFKETDKITLFQKQLSEQRLLLSDTNMQFLQEEQLISRLKHEGVSEDSTEREFSKASSAFVEYYNAVEVAEGSCAEDNREIKTARRHLEGDSSPQMLRSYFGEYDDDDDDDNDGYGGNR